MGNTPRIATQVTVRQADGPDACTLLAQRSGLSKAQVKETMSKGGAWLRRGRNEKRLRRATTQPRVGDRLSLYYDPEVLAMEPVEATCLVREAEYSVWFKPAGLLTQGSQWGDHCSLLRQAEKLLGASKIEPRLIHRLDREASGLLLLAHTPKAASLLARLFRENRVEKHYRVLALGNVRASHGEEGQIDTAIEGLEARTRFRVLAYDDEADRTLLEITIATGRLHQIRRHLEGIGHPVIGDPRYGKGNKDAGGMRLAAISLAFTCPFSREPRCYDLPEELIGW